jgi:hypothetical protein
MSEHVATRETQELDRLSERRGAVQALAADILLLWGTAEDRWRSVTWQDGNRTYCLSRGDFTQLQSGDEYQNEDWIHVLDGDEHDAYALQPNHEFSAPDETFVELADVMQRFANRTVFHKVREYLAAAPSSTSNAYYNDAPPQPREIRIQLDRHAAKFQDFTDAPYEPFIMVRVGDSYDGRNPEFCSYDLTENELRRPDYRNPYGPIRAEAPQEEHLRWFVRVVSAGVQAPEPRGYNMFAAPPREQLPAGSLVDTAVRRILAFERQESEVAQHRQLSPPRAEIAREAADILCGLEASHALYTYVERDGSTVLRTVVDIIEYDHSTQAGRTVETAVGFIVSNDSIVLETFATNDEDASRRVVFIDITASEASGMVMLFGVDGEPLRGDAAVDEAQEIVDAVCTAEAGRMLRPCTQDIAAGFESYVIRNSGR